MFEKDAEEYADKDFGMYEPTDHERYAKETDWRNGAEFGYNKANEWHYPSKGEYPKDEKNFQSYVVAYYGAKGSIANGKPCWEELCYDTENKRWVDKETLDDIPYVNQDGIVIAWKEIVLPKESEKENMDCVKTVSHLNHDCNYFSDEERSITKSAFKDGAEFGYNKAKEDVKHDLMMNLKDEGIVKPLKDSILRNERLSSQEQQEICAWIECAMDFGENLDECAKELAELNKANEWHYVKDELPDEGTYLVVWQNGNGYKEIFIMNYEEDDEEELHWVDGDCEVQDEYIVAWKELPNPPKEI